MQKLFFLLSLFLFSINAWSQLPENVNLNQLITETQLASDNPDLINLIWWIPKEYWEITFREDKTISEKEINDMMNLMENYHVLAIFQGKLGLFGGVTYESEEQLFKKLSLKDYYGDIHFPLKRDDIAPDMNNFLDIMKPMMANMLGNLGENFIFFVFDAKNSSKKFIANSFEDHDFEIILKDDATYKFDLPFSALLNPKICPQDKAEHNGKWNFCPFHGNKLEEKK